MKKMKNMSAMLLLLTATLFSCTDLEPEIKEFVRGEEYLIEAGEVLRRDISQIAGFIDPAYTPLYQWNGERNIYALTESSTDEMVTPTRGTDWGDNGTWTAMHQHTWTAEHSIVRNGWNDLSSGVARCYEVLNNLALISTDDPNFQADLAPYVAEIRTLRAYYLWQYIDLFGQMPYLDENNLPAVMNRVDGVNFIINDLESAIPVMLGKEDNVAYGRVVRQTAEALLAKIYLNLFIYEDRNATSEDMDNVIVNCDAIINSGQHSLSNDYFSIFDFDNESSPETLLVLQNSGDEGRGFDSQSHTFMTLHYNQSVNSGQPWNGMCVPEDFFYSWDADGNASNGVQTNDSRFQDDRYLDATGLHLGFLFGQQVDEEGINLEDRLGNPLVFEPEIGDLFSASEVAGARVVKWAPDSDAAIAQWMDNDVALLRYADVLLMKAEALWRKGDAPAALSIINNVRTTRGAGTISSISSDGQEILDERGFEFYWEGHRRTDLIRFDQFTNGTWWAKEVSEEFRSLYPIPAIALSANTNLIQNTGY